MSEAIEENLQNMSLADRAAWFRRRSEALFAQVIHLAKEAAAYDAAAHRLDQLAKEAAFYEVAASRVKKEAS